MRKIVQYGNPILEKKAKKVTDPGSASVMKLINDMLTVLESVKDHSAGISAPQIGESLQLAICRRVDLEEERDKDLTPEEVKKQEPIWEVMINPELTHTSKETSAKWEGCLSVNEGDLFAEVERPKEVTVEFENIEGDKITLKADDYFAHVVQHELDHLNGILFLKYVSDPEDLYTAEELEELEKEKRL